jgi:hypothetical protein
MITAMRTVLTLHVYFENDATQIHSAQKYGVFNVKVDAACRNLCVLRG